METNNDLNTESIAVLDTDTEWCKPPILKRLNGAKLELQHLICLISHPIRGLAFHHS